jgi:hypothetical protein
VILESLDVSTDEFERRTGWAIKPQGACKGDQCVPLPAGFQVQDIAERLGMPLVRDEKHGLWALGPESGGRVLLSAEAPDLVLPDLDGNEFALRSLRGQKIFLLAWASW